MPSFDDVWTDKMYTGITHIDDHHKKLVHLLIDVYNVAESKGTPARMREILAELVSYTKYHFSAEERLMVEIRYPRLDEQKAAHLWFTEKLNEHFLAISTKNQELPLQLLVFLREWYANHILKYDLDIGLFMKDPKRFGNS